MSELYFHRDLSQTVNTKLPFAERLNVMHRAAHEGTPRQAMQLYVLENYIHHEVDIRFAKVAQTAMAAASRGFKDAYTTFKDVPVARDLRFDLDILGVVNGALRSRLEDSGLSVLRAEGTRIVYTEPPGPEWSYWGEIDYLETVMQVGW